MVDATGEGGSILRERRKTAFTIGASLFVIALSVAACIPILIIVLVSFSRGGELYAGTLLPAKFVLDHYRSLFLETDFLIWMKNSLIVSVMTAFLAILFSSIGAYVLSRYIFTGKKIAISTLMIIQLFPGVMSLVALYKIFQLFHLLNTYFSLILIYLGGAIPFTTSMLIGFYNTVPRSMEDAARLDGANMIEVYTRIIVPMSLPILLVCFAFNFIAAYSDFLLAAVIITDAHRYTLALGLRSFLEGDFSTNWPIFSAAALIGAIPIIGMFLIFFRTGMKTTPSP